MTPPRSVDAGTRTLPGGPTGKGAILFCVGDRERNVCSFVWRIWWHETSFYLQTHNNETFGNMKVSLHGPDDDHPRAGFKIGPHRTPGDEPSPLNGLLVETPDWLPCWFYGRQVSEHAVHAIRFRFPFGLFLPRYPFAPVPGDVKKSHLAGVFPPPSTELRATDLDVYVSKRRPYWPKEKQARRDDACVGPLESKAGEHLTVVAVDRSTVLHPTPKRAQAPRPRGEEDSLRGIGATVDDHGVLWICEQWMSRTGLEEAGAQ
jgi:hypothetical protein